MYPQCFANLFVGFHKVLSIEMIDSRCFASSLFLIICHMFQFLMFFFFFFFFLFDIFYKQIQTIFQHWHGPIRDASRASAAPNRSRPADNT